MLKINRLFFMKVHLILATFIFPIIVMFLVTGALYILGIEGSYDKQVYTIKLNTPLQNDDNSLTDFVANELKNLNISPPTVEVNNFSKDGVIKLEWRGAALRVALESTQPTEARLTVQKASWYKKLLELHTAHGTTAFKVYTLMLAISLLMLLITGFIMALQLPKYRKMTLYSTATGVAVFVVMIIIC